MAQLWGGRFTKETDRNVKAFGDSIFFDKRLWRQDIRGSIVHAKMLGKQNILTKEETDNIVEGLNGIYDDIENGKLVIDNSCEDIHSFVESHLIDRIGDDGKRLHTGRSRNDQVALDMRLYTRESLDETKVLLGSLLSTILTIMEENVDTFMPGFTHLQKAQPVTLSHHFGAYFEMFKRDVTRLDDTRDRLNECPLGAGALAGTTYPLDREYTARELGFRAPTANSMDSVSDRDYLLEYLFDLSLIQMHLSRLSEEIITWNTNEYQFVEIDDGYSTGSSIMPQKKNPDVAELIRGKTGRVYGDLTSLLTMMKGLPLAYDKDMQEDKEAIFDAFDTVNMCLTAFNPMVETMTVKTENMRHAAASGFINATDCADYLVGKGLPFRDAYKCTGELVALCIKEGLTLETLPLEKYQAVCDLFDDGVYEAINLERCVSQRTCIGAPAPENVEKRADEVLGMLKK